MVPSWVDIDLELKFSNEFFKSKLSGQCIAMWPNSDFFGITMIFLAVAVYQNF